VARRDKAYLVIWGAEIKTVADCQEALLSVGIERRAEYYHPRLFGSYDGKLIYVIETLSADAKERFQYELTNPPQTLSRAEVTRRARLCRQLKGNSLVALPEDHMKTAYTWEAEKRKVRDVDRGNLMKVDSFITFHTFGYVLFFKPSVAEVLSQLPGSLFENESKRYLIETEMLTDYAPASHIYDTYHMAVTTVYEDPGDPVVIDLTGRKRPLEESQSESAQTCIICFDKPADTLVLPCMHQVVCKGCSEELKETPDHRTCVRCRCEIMNVLADD